MGETMGGGVVAVGDGIHTVGKTVGGGFVAVGETVGGGIVGSIQTVGQTMGGGVYAVGNGIHNVGKNMSGGVVAVGESVGGGIVGGVRTVGETVGGVGAAAMGTFARVGSGNKARTEGKPGVQPQCVRMCVCVRARIYTHLHMAISSNLLILFRRGKV